MKTNLVIIVLAVIFAGAVGYFAYNYGHDAGRAEGLAAVNSFFGDQQRFPGGANRQGGNGQFPQGGAQGNNPAAALFGGVQGTVDKIDGNALTVTVTRGQQTQQVKVNLSSTTTVETFATGSIGDVKVGSRILVGMDRQQAQAQATPGATGQGGQFQVPSEVTARTITVLPASFGQ